MDLTPLLTSRTVALVGLVCIVLSALAALWGMVKLSYQRALGKPMPRNGLTATLDVLAELAVNVVGAVSRVLKLGTGEGLFRPTVPLAAGERAPLFVVAEKQGALDVSATRPSGVAHTAQIFAPQIVPPVPTPADGNDPADEDAHASIFPPAPFDPHRTMRGHTSLSAALAAVALLGIAGAVGLMVMGCPVSQQLTRPALGPVDGCEPRSTRCAPDGRPQVCSGSRRWTDADVACVTAGQVAAVCCLTTSPITGRELHACVLAERCLPVDGGAR